MNSVSERIIEKIKSEQPENIIYVSCNYKNFIQEYLNIQSLYEIKKLTAVDMFPHVPHVELVIVLKKSV